MSKELITLEEDDGSDLALDEMERDSDWLFCLTESNWQPKSGDAYEIENKIYFLGADDVKIRERLNGYYQKWNTPKGNCLLRKDNRRKYNAVNDKRKEFSESEEAAKEELNLSVWKTMVPCEDDYLECIGILEKIAKKEQGGRKGAYKIYFDLANINMKLAIEFQKHKNEEAVQYYYAKSIEGAMNALPYAVGDEKKWNKTYRFVRNRYNEVADNRTYAREDIKERAKCINRILLEWER